MQKYVLMVCLAGTLLGPGCGGSSSGPILVQPGLSADSAIDGQHGGQRVSIAGNENSTGRPSSGGMSGDDISQISDQSPVSGLAGKWLMTLVFEAETAQLWMIEITGNEQSYDAKVVESLSSIDLAKPEIRGFRQLDDQLHFELAQGKDVWPFDGRIEAGRVRGCIEVRDRLTLAWLERTRLSSMVNVPASNPLVGWGTFDAAQQVSDPRELVRQMREFADRYSDSPLVFDALRAVLRTSRRAELSEEELRQLTERYESLAEMWGKRWSEHACESIGLDLATAEGPANSAADAIALKYAEKASAALPEGASASRKQSVQMALAVALVRNNRAEEGKNLLDELLNREPAEAEVLHFYAAQAAEKLADLDGAIELLIPLWPHPVATREIERIWQQKNGTLAGLDERLDEIYLKRFPTLTVEVYPGRKNTEANQVALAELFTGTSCPPCVATDFAFEALGRTFNRTELILLQYHLHVPGPDPLCNADTIARARYYNVDRAPWFLLNGRETTQASGTRQRGPDVYAEYRANIETQMERKSDAELKLSATRNQDEIAIDVTMADIPAPGEELRLRVAIVEETVRYHGSNGVRLHHAVVRAMPGGAEGIGLTEPNLTHHTTVNIAELRNSLGHELTEFEKQISERNERSFEFPSKPLELKHLRVIAFLQDDSTRSVLQAASVQLDKD